MNTILFLLVLTLCLYKLGKRRVALIFLILTVTTFLLFSTAYLPAYVTRKLESRYQLFDPAALHDTTKAVYIHVLGAGYTADNRLVPLQQLSSPTLARLTEGIRIMNLLPNSKLITSGYAASGTKSLAEIAALAAGSLGVRPQKIDTLSTATTTLEEAQACKAKYGTDINLILVTDALHMPRAMAFFTDEGFHPIPAPTNYLMKDDENLSLPWLPSNDNMLLMDRILREWFAQLKNLIL